MDKRYLRSIRLLAECMQLFEKSSSARVRSCGFTESQFDIIATLGNTPGMTCKELGEKTLITKGTLTGVLDRLEDKGLIQRERGDDDRRQLLIKLTPAGEQAFTEVFPKVVEEGQQRFAGYNEQDFLSLERELLKLKNSLSKATPI
ncbi:MAG: MarR family transcriptional regulator [Undibacterium sp.]|uniref:MarR family winged helix-turn-helix transcriptional regulator n=1 Tax=Undibacterium sp. TaxID=1914977 RepID=UPI00271EBB2E|nr:MarR family transcriptional regulator [Undibacterium sp.]MDO8654064.1 MarR family transcriptional regulator [Undibacterium sp.]